ncbi:MAG: GxxExxY protein [Candidatus Marinimicrobia bacterium]|nr:GxxExxY protein [Candidatus Neomarinimicrobiota bacterium]MCH7764017.1 GxxExxY protein [Candidatus Neomarinimicrobiota bacterium]
MDELIYKEEVYAIIGAAIEVHKELGPGFLEAVYEECMGIESNKRQIPFETQVELDIQYKGITLQKKYIADYIGYGKIVAEFKSIPKLTKVDEAQIINYLKATGTQIGLLINFGSKGTLEWKRYIFSK